MPATGSDLPLTGLIAVLSIASALGIRAARRDS
jgi:sortase A